MVASNRLAAGRAGDSHQAPAGPASPAHGLQDQVSVYPFSHECSQFFALAGLCALGDDAACLVWRAGDPMSGTLHPGWLVPSWPAPAGVRAVFTTRAGGVSALPFDSMNLGSHVGDRPDAVAANRALLQRATEVQTVFLNQVHGARAQLLDAATPEGQTADACFTAQRRLACTIMVADCLPVLLTTSTGSVVAAVHAGWRGLAGVNGQGVLESVLKSFRALAQAATAQPAIKIVAWLGPCIGPSAFEVGSEVKAAFETTQPETAGCFVPAAPGKYLADLAGLARLRLQALGISEVYGNDGSAAWCTVSNSALFFSHRRDAAISGNGFGTTGRMAACIWLD